MLRLIPKLSVAVLAFVIGVIVALFWRTSPPVQPQQIEIPKASVAQSQPLIISLCDIQREPELYEGKLVDVRGEMYSVRGKLLLLGCDDPVGVTWVDICGFGKLDDGIKPLLEGEGKSSRANKKEADVTVIGTVHKYDDEFIPARIVPFRIELRSPLRKFRPHGAA